MVSSHRRRRRGVRGNSRPECGSGLRGRDKSTRNVVPIPSAQINHTAGVDCSEVCPRGCFGSNNSVGRQLTSPDTHRQHGSVPHHLQFGFVQSVVNDRAPAPSPSLSPDESYYSSVMAPLSSKKPRRQSEQVLESRRPSSDALMLASVAISLQLQTVRRYWPLGETPAARSKVIRAPFAELWRDGNSRLCNPPSPWIWATLLKIKSEKAHGIIVFPNWTGAPWFAMLRQICLDSRVILPGDGIKLFTSEHVNPAWSLLLAEVGTRAHGRSNGISPLSCQTLPQQSLQ